MNHEIQFVAITFDDGSVGIMQLILDPRVPEGTTVPGWNGSRRIASDDAIQYEIDKSAWAPRTPVRWRRIDFAEIPTDRTFRNAWRGKGNKVEVDMDAAREIHRDHLRELRAPKLAELDTAYIRADENNDQATKVRIAKQKQALRDVTDDPAIDAAKTPEKLRAAVPKALL
jgi:hypothetical protein